MRYTEDSASRTSRHIQRVRFLIGSSGTSSSWSESCVQSHPRKQPNTSEVIKVQLVCDKPAREQISRLRVPHASLAPCMFDATLRQSPVMMRKRETVVNEFSTP